MKKRPTFERACAEYVHRFTMEHVPAWARGKGPEGADWFYAPHFASDREWYEHTVFPGEPEHPEPRSRRGDCYTTGQTWPLGQRLAQPYTGQRARA